MKEFHELIKDFAKYCVLPLSIFILFKNGIDNIFTKYIVNPILSLCYPANIKFDIALVLLALIITIPLLLKLVKGAKVSNKFFFFSLSYFVIYLVYRFSNATYTFTETRFVKVIKLTDIINIFPFFIVLGYIVINIIRVIKKCKSKDHLNNNDLGFTVDEATTIDYNNDILNRSKFIDEIANKIKNTETKNASFAIGVVAKWGAGKSTFIYSLLDRFTTNEFIKIELNVWKCSNNGQIIETLFKQLQSELKDYSFSINNKLQEYTSNLLKGTKNENLNTIRNLAELILPDTSLEKQYDSINEEIKRIDKKIIIVIDDLDRLDKNEIYEVIRLIRNTANFANSFFIVAYDRNYILNAIEEINPYQTHYFLEKIFQIEFSLPAISEKVLQNEIRKRIEPILTDEGKKGYEMLQDRGIKFFEYSDADLTTLYIHNIRDVVRFVNSLKLSYQFVKDEVYFPDFYNLELIKFKHPDLFSIIYKEHQKFFTVDRERVGSLPYSGHTYFLKSSNEDQGKMKTYELKKFIENEKDTLKLNDKDLDIIFNSFNSIFPDPNNILSSRRDTPSHYLSVLKPSMFDRYFILGIEGKLSQIEFSNMRQMQFNEFICKLEELTIVKKLSWEISERLEEITEFDNKEDFIKIIKGIFHFANLQNPDIEDSSYNDGFGYNGEVLAKLIGNERNILFFKNKEFYKEFFFEMFKNNKGKYCYTDEFINTLLRKNYYYISNIFTDKEISQLALSNFKIALEVNTTFTFELWWFFCRCEIREEKNINSNQTQIFYKVNIEAVRLMRKFIWEKGIDDFLVASINEHPVNNKFYIELMIREIFKTNELFAYLLKKDKRHLKYKDEFLRFYEALTTDENYINNGVPLSFFKVIPVNKRKSK